LKFAATENMENAEHQTLKRLEQVANISNELKSRIATLQEASFNTSEGNSLLHIRNVTLLSYLSSLVFHCCLKVNALAVDDEKFESILNGNVKKLVEYRLVLEKTKNIKGKLQYELDKLLKSAKVGEEAAENDLEEEEDEEKARELQYKPHLELLRSDPIEKDAIYRPPRISAAFPSTMENKKEKLQKKARDSRLLKDVAQQYDTRPEQQDVQGIGFTADYAATSEDKLIKERKEYEEEHFMRMALSRKDKKMEKRMHKQGGLLRFKNEFQVIL
jgi:U3 small nucleolar ribonucleoprotein protein LCP5